jgi:ribosomal protein S18 acetylase RimI-like enzyme
MSAPTIPRAQIRRAGPDEAEALSAICRATFTETFGHLYPPADLKAFLDGAYAPERLGEELADPDTAVWLAEQDDEVVGYVQAGLCSLPHPGVGKDSGELKRLYLLARAQNGGLGGRLFDAALGWLEARRLKEVWIGVWSENHGAQRFYGRRGFEKVGEYDFAVGLTLDREFILRRTAQ